MSAGVSAGHLQPAGRVGAFAGAHTPARGAALADQGADTRLIQDSQGQRNIQHMVKYTASNSARFQRLWQ